MGEGEGEGDACAFFATFGTTRRGQLGMKTSTPGREAGRTNNLLLALDRLGGGQSENFLTEAFGHLLNHMASSSPKQFRGLMQQMTGGKVNLDIESARELRITTQQPTAEGTPDIELLGKAVLVYFEIKRRSEIDEEQLRHYSSVLGRSSADQKTLVLLTRWAGPTFDIPLLDSQILWSQVHAWLTEAQARERDPVVLHLIREFNGFLEGTEMAVTRIGWELSPGLSATFNLRRMLIHCLPKKGYKPASGANAESIGVYFSPRPRGSTHWVGVWLDKPERLGFAGHESVARERDATFGFALMQEVPIGFVTLDVKAAEGAQLFAPLRRVRRGQGAEITLNRERHLAENSVVFGFLITAVI